MHDEELTRRVYDTTIKGVNVRGRPPVTWGNKLNSTGKKWLKNLWNGACELSVDACCGHPLEASFQGEQTFRYK